MSDIGTPGILECEIVVIGGGASGLSAAVAAAEKGVDVILLEKRHALGGSAALAEGLLAAESPAQKRLKINTPRDELFKIAMSYARWKLNPRIVRAFIDKSGDTIQWLENKGLFFDWIPSYYPGQTYRTWHCIRGRGIKLINVLARSCEELHVRLFFETQAKKLLTDGRGNVTGVIAERGGKKVQFNSRNVIIATGGYGGNKELLKKYNPYYTEDMQHLGAPNRGDGLIMATEIGAAMEGLGLIAFGGHAPSHAPEELRAISEEPNLIWVNKNGERFIDEAAGFNHWESVNAVIQQPERICYTLFDERIKQNIVEKGVVKGRGVVVCPGTKLPNLGKTLELATEKGTVKISNSWNEIAGWLGAKPDTLKATINEYNTYCQRRHDDLFVKDPRYLETISTPPYYAIKCYPIFVGTIGGIKINHHMEVLDRECNPISGLWAAGNDTGGWESDTYNANLAGTTFGFAVNSGRIAAENATAHIKK
jgi:fumarate reductase flavoprotein subunit